eukprot:TRINITY_DN89191_c0_g1_i1.p1 TRINITY_DN89191_c0_g1~~TRINITY_DN89191_c0_g1_i1.p1  ORF type:complete len:539 (+),score=54.05 TRINITY_DN89191_c0_g1_i1:113-1618(+)
MAVMPSLPFYAMMMGANAFDIALLGTVFNLAQMFCAPLFGVLSDKWGRKRILLLGLLAQAVFNMMQASVQSLWSMTLVRGLMGVACSTGPAETAFLIDGADDEKDLNKAMILQRVVVTLGAITGPIIAKLFSQAGFQTLCYGMVLSNLIGVGVGACFWQETSTGTTSATSPSGSLPRTLSFDASPMAYSPVVALVAHEKEAKWYRTIADRRTGLLLLVSLTVNLGIGVSQGPEVVFFKDHFGFGQAELTSLLLATCAAALVFTPFLPPIMTTFGNQRACVAGSIAFSILNLFLVLGTGLSWVPYVYATLCVGLTGSMITFGYMGLLNKIVPKSKLGLVLGVKGFVDSFAGAVAPAVGGAIYVHDHFLPYGLTCGFSAIAAGLFASLAPLQEAELSDEEVEPMLPTPQLSRESHTPMASPLLFTKGYSVRLLGHELTFIDDDDVKTLLHRRGTDSRGLRRATTIATESLKNQREEDDSPLSLPTKSVSTKPKRSSSHGSEAD